MSKGIIYVLTNPAFPDLVKIGKTASDAGFQGRMRDLYTTGVPFPFSCEYACEVDDMDKVERKIHSAFGKNRVNSKREFFEISPERIIDILQIVPHTRVDVTIEYEDKVEQLESEKAIQKIQNKRSKFNFSDFDIEVGTTLYHTKKNEQTCVVAQTNNVIFRGELTSPSQSAFMVLNELGYKSQSVQGTAYWSLDGKESLHDMRLRLEKSE